MDILMAQFWRLMIFLWMLFETSDLIELPKSVILIFLWFYISNPNASRNRHHSARLMAEAKIKADREKRLKAFGFD